MAEGGKPAAPTPAAPASTPTPENEKEPVVFRDNPVVRELGLVGRIGRLLKPLTAASRYVAYSSDVGEAFRPVVPAKAVTATYGIAWAYVIGDVAYSGYRAKQAEGTNDDVVRACTHTLSFQLLASIALPAVAIHTQVHTAQRVCNHFKPLMRFRKWGPTIAGLALLPILPVVIDEPVETAVDWAFDTYWPKKESAAHPPE